MRALGVIAVAKAMAGDGPVPPRTLLSLHHQLSISTEVANPQHFGHPEFWVGPFQSGMILSVYAVMLRLHHRLPACGHDIPCHEQGKDEEEKAYG